MIRIFLTYFVLLALTINVYGWGQKGHRIVGLIAERHLTKKAAQRIQEILGHQTIAEVGTFMDEIRSDDRYHHMAPWHYCTIPDGKTYEEVGTPNEGDAIEAMNRLIVELKTKKFTDEDEAFALKLLIHLVGDIHQPLHVGNGKDRGGNDVKVTYFGKSRNLHSVWDTWIIEEQNYSYTEYTNAIDHIETATVEEWQSASMMDWVYESMSYRKQVYTMPADKNISYEYNYKNLPLINQRLQQAGVRLAGLLNEIYG